ncbi:MAG: hypothetical protein EKK47_06085 [Burkholderiales bacterium]|nr:MAG: hypothetical protein EKK47_06085 [Burkholderiales bacterium]
MTAEVAVLNRLGVAMASDSAASVCHNYRTKLYHADKLFMLSSSQPVGIMVNNSSLLTNLPWETVIKVFREQLGSRSFDRLEGYSEAFFQFLAGRTELFPSEAQEDFILDSLRNCILNLKELAVEIVFEQYGFHKGWTEDYMVDLGLDEALRRTIERWKSKPSHPAMGHSADVITRMSKRIYLESVPYIQTATQTRTELLYELARLLVEKEGVMPETISNIVISGFGNKDYLPALQEFEVAGVFGDRLKHRNIGGVLRITGSEPAAIRTFAQTEVAENFLYGSSMQVHTSMIRNLSSFVIQQAEAIIDGYPRTNKAKKNEYKERVIPLIQDGMVALFEEIRKRRDEKYYDPIIQSIAHLPKNELAQVAATLVGLSSFQKRVSMYEDETVGGPVDVAVITRGDGFVWVERKHYFKPELNPHYFVNRRAGAAEQPQAGTRFADKTVIPARDEPDSSSKGATQ